MGVGDNIGAMEKVGRYRVERRIGAGSFATVWLGHDDELDVPVAIKVLADNWSGNADVRSRFLAEARIMRRIRDPRLVQVYDIGTLDEDDGAGGRPYFVMDYVDGGSLNDLRRTGLEPARALRLAVGACRALDVLHQHDIIHRDVTPGNLLLAVGEDGAERVLVADLGVAKSLVDAVGATMTAGTPSYMAPEQAAGVAQLDRRSDIYSLTAVTYALLTGLPPFVVSNISDILTRDPAVAPRPIAATVGAPNSLDGVLLSGLAWDRERRPPTALLLAEGLEAIADQLATTAGTVRLKTLPPDVPAPWSVIDPVESVTATTLAPFTTTGSTRSWSSRTPVDPRAEAGPVAGPPSAPVVPVRRSRTSYAVLGLAAAALFALSMVVTLLLMG